MKNCPGNHISVNSAKKLSQIAGVIFKKCSLLSKEALMAVYHSLVGSRDEPESGPAKNQPDMSGRTGRPGPVRLIFSRILAGFFFSHFNTFSYDFLGFQAWFLI